MADPPMAGPRGRVSKTRAARDLRLSAPSSCFMGSPDGVTGTPCIAFVEAA